MLTLIQRVTEAKVVIDGHIKGEIGPGLLVLICAEPSDTEVQSDKLLSKILKLRIFGDAAGKMNNCIQNMDGLGAVGGLLIVSQFTLAADTLAGNRPGFTGAAPPAEGRRLYDYFVAQARLAHPVVYTGQFGAEMKVHLVNDGPVTIPMRISAA